MFSLSIFNVVVDKTVLSTPIEIEIYTKIKNKINYNRVIYRPLKHTYRL